jgi:phage tail-like protein
VDQLQHRWHRLHAKIEMPAGAHIQFFTFAADAGPAPAVDPAATSPFATGWQAHPPDVTDLLLDTQPARLLWIGAHFTADGGQATPALSQLRVQFDHTSYLPFLPEIYREKASCDDFLLRLLSLYESFFDEVEGDIGNLASILDPYAIPEEHLAWLAGFLALELPETLGEGDRRERVAGAFERYAKRGTVQGLVEELRLSTGIHAVIEEPAQYLGVWSLAAESAGGGNSILGLTTMLASSEPQGAVVGRSATLDRSQIISQEEFGAPLFDAVAHRFTVLVYAGEAQCEGRLDEIRAVLDREKPAHTTYDLCVLETGMSVGFQCRLGIDTVVGGQAGASPLGDGNLILAGQQAGRMGITSHVGVGTRL